MNNEFSWFITIITWFIQFQDQWYETKPFTIASKIKILYLGSPRYRLSLVAQYFKTAEKTLKPILEKIEKNASKLDGSFKFSREGSKKTGEG